MSNSLISALTALRDFLWGVPCTVMLIGGGIYFTCISKWYPLSGIGDISGSLFKAMFGRKKNAGGISPLMALSTALGGTVGIGSIVGIAYAISVGGPGAVFWMWVSGFFGLMLKYSECALAVKYRVKKGNCFVGGAMYAFSAMGMKKTALLFSIACILVSLGTGGVTQINAAAEMMRGWNIPSEALGIIFAVITAFIIFGGQKKIAHANEIIMPLVSAVYLLMVCVILIKSNCNIYESFLSIFKGAFGLKQAGAGIGAGIFITAFRTGFSKGVFSNEAGMGSSPIAHASSESTTPHLQGQWGIFEVFFDTFVVSTLTALALLASNTTRIEVMFSRYFGDGGALIFILSTVIFAFAAMLSWCFYAESCLMYLSERKSLTYVYRCLFILTIYYGAVTTAELAWLSADIFNTLMIFPNILLLWLKRREIKVIVNMSKPIKKKYRKGRNETGGFDLFENAGTNQ